MKDLLYEAYHRLIQSLAIPTQRFLYASFSLKNRLVGIIGPRGVGKTTLMLQYIKAHPDLYARSFYFTADHLYFNQHTLIEFVNELYHEYAITHVFIDEVHKYKNWSQEIKNIFDQFPKIHLVFSGSSSLNLTHGSHDLSRRAKLYHLPGLSFREYLNFKTGSSWPAIALDALLGHPMKYNATLPHIPQISYHFKQYLSQGYYPFVFEDELSFSEKVIQIIEKTLYEDVAEYYHLRTESLYQLKRILSFLSSIPPGEINVHQLAKNLSVDFKTAFHYLTILHETGLVSLLYAEQGGNAALKKPEKMYLRNVALLSALEKWRGAPSSLGTLRELFFLQTMSDAGHPVYYSKTGDFSINGQLFEVGGKNKTKAQLKKTNETGFLVKDEILSSTAKHIIPLYYFGFLY